ncbi:hypothetical protein V5E97_20775 [Singulisphaera sp. Ch08]|uniref:Uncharacterized protein n=1 Tax=Singulisphaera sp. Ch08 TaxID=3120278 RepID=A0AAU7C6K3_9BACT
MRPGKLAPVDISISFIKAGMREGTPGQGIAWSDAERFSEPGPASAYRPSWSKIEPNLFCVSESRGLNWAATRYSASASSSHPLLFESAVCVDQAVMEFAKPKGFDEPPPER